MKRIHTENLGNKTAKVYHDSDWQEYRVRLYIGGVLHAAADYFTADIADAIDTAIMMLRPPLVPISDRERFGAISWQSIANLVLRESADSADRVKAQEFLNAGADDMTEYWASLSIRARSRILGAMALDLSALGFIPAANDSRADWNRKHFGTQAERAVRAETISALVFTTGQS